VGKAKIDTTIEEVTTTQAIKVIANDTTRVYPFGSSQRMDSAFWGSVYEMDTTDKTTAKLENISWIPIGDEFFSNEINVPTRAFSEGFPGITDRFEWFSVVYEGAIVPPASGTYTFKLLCDDGARLYIDGDVVVEGDGIHVPLTYEGGVYLDEGEVYDFVLEYFQGPRFHIALVLEVQIPGREMRLFNMADFEWSDSE